ncbi:uncharacterized protein PHACADRAFT_27503 [Phanerochaete carnosa HHB-10118-sp]|uniref:Uncharacterized protein n=1 Tax=Phanerochaete carnosa (strain HHB-10118-sp) TaxID=650164 RepID=K5X1Q4_PHACS|nr:uncharacterized protein PHACADRAFT_27503 [Phanerochaete carnosa HHB-10118-sp]EKM56712.1 hypothetical protein PHACADRAFT_27503 [Phanerochaete carnosa HHB-10118-sp]
MGANDRVDEPQSYYEQGSTVVRRAVKHVGETYTKPGMDRVGQSFDRRPIFTAFVVIFSFLSLIPVLSFAAFTVFVFGLFFSLAFGAALLASLFVVLIAVNSHAHSVQGGFLACTLLLLLLVASFLTCSALGTLVAGRLVFYMRVHGLRDGLGAWAQEMRGRLLSSAEEPAEKTEDIVIKPEQGKQDEHLSDSSSTVVVEGAPHNDATELWKQTSH